MSEPIATALRSGNAQSALELANALLEAAPDAAESHYWQALALQSLRRKNEALAAIDRAIALAPENGEYAMLRSVMQLDDKDPGAAQAGLMDALALNPNQLEAYVGLIHIALGQKNPAEAKRLLRLAERVDADATLTLLARGALAQFEGDLEAALAAYTRASEQEPDNAMALSSLGMLYLQKQMPVFAEQALTRANSLSPGKPALLRALIQSQLTQENYAEAEASVDALLAVQPYDASSLLLRAQLRQARNELAGALDDVQRVMQQHPGHLNALTLACTLHIQNGTPDKALTLLENALAADTDNEALWQLRFGFESSFNPDSQPFIERWLAQQPNSAKAHEAYAVMAEGQGRFGLAGEQADAALALSEAVPLAHFVKLRQELRENPAAAKQRLAGLAERAQAPEAQRMVLGWMGITDDRLGSYAEAAQAFLKMAQFVLPGKTLPTPFPAEQVPESDARGHLLWAPPGLRIERVLNVLAPILGERLLADRNQASAAREDGFGADRFAPGTEQAGSALSWRMGIAALGLQPETCVDWLPHWDAYTSAALQGTRLTALVIDPRDALLNWMVFGSAQSFVFHPKIKQAAKWLSVVHHAVADSLEANPDAVTLLRFDNVDSDAETLAGQLQQALDLPERPSAEQMAAPVMALGGMPNQFPSGHWRHYKNAMADAFEILTPVAVRLGYPQD